jgi:hypothetical protein
MHWVWTPGLEDATGGRGLHESVGKCSQVMGPPQGGRRLARGAVGAARCGARLVGRRTEACARRQCSWGSGGGRDWGDQAPMVGWDWIRGRDWTRRDHAKRMGGHLRVRGAGRASRRLDGAGRSRVDGRERCSAVCGPLRCCRRGRAFGRERGREDRRRSGEVLGRRGEGWERPCGTWIGGNRWVGASNADQMQPGRRLPTRIGVGLVVVRHGCFKPGGA